MRFISRKTHAVLDYIVGLLLIAGLATVRTSQRSTMSGMGMGQLPQFTWGGSIF